MSPLSAFGQPIGEPVAFTPPPLPPRTPLAGSEVLLRPLGQADAADLLAATAGDEAAWTYLRAGPCRTLGDAERFIATLDAPPDALPYLVTDRGGQALGTVSLLRAQPDAGSIEVGWVLYSPALRQTRAATEAQHLLARLVFDLGYRRYEWKCDALNAPSRSAAERLGFTYEGTFRQAQVVRGHNRDTAWYSLLDREWPTVRRAQETWLAETPPGGQQYRSLTAILAAERGAEGAAAEAGEGGTPPPVHRP